TGHPGSSDATGSTAAEADSSSENAETNTNIADTTQPPQASSTTASASSESVDAPPPREDTSAPKIDSAAPSTGGSPAAPPAMNDVAAPDAGGQKKADVDENEVRFGGIRVLAPPGWVRERPPIKLILAEFSLPRSEGDSYDAQLTVTLAVKNDPKSLERLREQLKDEEEAKDSDVQKLTISGHEVVLVDSSGDEEDEADPLSSSENKGRYRSQNAMVFLDGLVYFINCSGPEKTVTDRVGEFRAFLETMEAVE
ncbi:MAG: hypothetical protein JJ992_26055, partial [Planctomycetes bacterium]|nr:hypothetical protein [Planctomycetota bacterium]